MISYDSLFGFTLVVGENMKIYIHVLYIFSFLTSSKPFKHILILLKSDSALLRGNLWDVAKSATKCARVGNSVMQYIVQQGFGLSSSPRQCRGGAGWDMVPTEANGCGGHYCYHRHVSTGPATDSLDHRAGACYLLHGL